MSEPQQTTANKRSVSHAPHQAHAAHTPHRASTTHTTYHACSSQRSHRTTSRNTSHYTYTTHRNTDQHTRTHQQDQPHIWPTTSTTVFHAPRRTCTAQYTTRTVHNEITDTTLSTHAPRMQQAPHTYTYTMRRPCTTPCLHTPQNPVKCTTKPRTRAYTAHACTRTFSRTKHTVHHAYIDCNNTSTPRSIQAPLACTCIPCTAQNTTPPRLHRTTHIPHRSFTAARLYFITQRI